MISFGHNITGGLILNNYTDDCLDPYWCKEKEEQKELLISKLKDEYECVGIGKNRIVFKLKSGNYVLKFPLTTKGEVNNFWENQIVSGKKYRKIEKERGIFPPSKIINYNGFTCIVMDYIDVNIPEKIKMPEWTMFSGIKKYGVNKKGLVFNFSYGYY